jgi:preprotein translocase subunit SecD
MAFARRFGCFVFVACALAIAIPIRAAECPPPTGSIVARPLEAKNAPPWGSLRIWHREARTLPVAAEAEVARTGGSRLLLQVDRDSVRRELLAGLRAETVRVLRQERIVWANPPAIRGDSVEVRFRDTKNMQRVLKLFAEQIALPLDTSLARRVEISDLGNGLVRLTPSEAEVTARIDADQIGAMWILEKRANGLGLSGASVRPAGPGRIRAVVPGLFDPQQLIHALYLLARLDFRLVDTSIDACEAANGRAPPDAEVIFREDRQGPVLVKKQPLMEPADVFDTAVALARPADRPTVIFRLMGAAGYQFAKATREHVGQSFAVVLDLRPVAIVRIAEPLGGRVQLSGDLDLNQAEQLSILLRAGHLPAKLVIVEQQIVPSPDQ